jgi:hypothetical protein
MSFSNPLPAGIRQVVPDYVSNGAALTYDFPFRLWNVADLAVLVQAVGATIFSPLALGTGFTVTINSLTDATVTLAAAQPAGTLIRLMGLRTPSRLTSVVNDGSVQSGPLESELDVIEATLQEVRRDVTAAQSAVGVETARAEAAEAVLTASIAAETTRAETAEGALAALFGMGTPFVTLRQVMQWAAALGVLYAIDNVVPADIANAVTIQWRRGQVMKSADGLYAFIQTTLGYTNAQMIAAFSLMQGYAP